MAKSFELGNEFLFPRSCLPSFGFCRIWYASYEDFENPCWSEKESDILEMSAKDCE